jgi:hypothetical protein
MEMRLITLNGMIGSLLVECPKEVEYIATDVHLIDH